jgi:hypothetical protein
MTRRPPRYALTAIAGVFIAAWIVTAHPAIVAWLAFTIAVTGLVAVLGVLGWLVLFAGVDPVELPDDDEADRPYGGGW